MFELKCAVMQVSELEMGIRATGMPGQPRLARRRCREIKCGAPNSRLHMPLFFDLQRY